MMLVPALLFFASTVGLASAQSYNPRTSCTSRSATVPGWLITDVQWPSDTKIRFDVSNRATGYNQTVSCALGANKDVYTCGKASPEDHEVDGSVRITETSIEFSLEQSWVCSDRGKDIKFKAIGTQSVAPDYTSPILVRGSLLEPVKITPQYPEGPWGHSSPGCLAKSETPTWVISSIHTLEETGDGIDTVPYKGLHLTITNLANGYEASCMPNTGFSYTNSPQFTRLVCSGDEFQGEDRVGQYPISTSASFQDSTKTLTINQTWYCDDVDPAKPVQITASATASLPMSCTTRTLPETNQIQTLCTSSGPLSLTGTISSTTTLAPYVLTDPRPTRDGCTLTSLLNPRWTFSHFRIYNGSVPSPESIPPIGVDPQTPIIPQGVSFDIILAAEERGFQYPIEVYQGEEKEGGWHECVIGPDGENGVALWPYWCEFRWDGGTRELRIRARWECEELSSVEKVKFYGETVTTVGEPLVCGNENGWDMCTTENPGYSWSATIENVTLDLEPGL